MGYSDVPAWRVYNAGAIVVTIGLFFLLLATVLGILMCFKRHAARLVQKVHTMTDLAQLEDDSRPTTPVVEPQRPGPPTTPALENGRKAKQYFIEDEGSYCIGIYKDYSVSHDAGTQLNRYQLGTNW